MKSEGLLLGFQYWVQLEKRLLNMKDKKDRRAFNSAMGQCDLDYANKKMQ